MKRLLLPLLAVLALPNVLYAEISKEEKERFEEIKKEVVEEFERREAYIHKWCLKYVDYQLCRERDKKTTIMVRDLRKKDKSSMYKLIGDICEAGEKGMLKNPHGEFVVIREIYKKIYPATEEEKKTMMFDNISVRSDVFEIVKYTAKSYPGCLIPK